MHRKKNVNRGSGNDVRFREIERQIEALTGELRRLTPEELAEIHRSLTTLPGSTIGFIGLT
ncbi:MAG: hypothetical protein H5U03_08585 [Clostridia bacterium]|nr:hypothetical protein [Clostridia bacterium]